VLIVELARWQVSYYTAFPLRELRCTVDHSWARAEG
jgi:hypothetical protein